MRLIIRSNMHILILFARFNSVRLLTLNLFLFQVADTMNYFRALLHKQEHSLRALEVCTEAIDLSPPNYTAWRYRRCVLSAME